MSEGTLETDPKLKLSRHGLFVILAATAVALLATPLASPAMPEIARVFAQNAQNEPFARAILNAISILPGNPDVIFLVKFILLSIPALFIIVSAPIVGWLSDNVGRKSLLNGSLLIFGISGVSGYFADSFLFMFVGRAILGVTIAGIKTATVAMVGDYYQGAERNKVVGWQGTAMKIGAVIFLLLGGYMANFSWQMPFLGYLLGFLILPSGLIALSESLPAIKAISEPTSSTSLPAVPFWPSTYVFISAFLASGLFFVTLVQLPFYLANAFDATPFEMGAGVAVGNAVGALISLVYYQFKRRMNYVAIYAFIFLSMGLGYFVVAWASSYATVLLGMILAGLGFGLYVPNHSSWILSIVSPMRRGFGVGLVTTAMFAGQFFSPIIVQPFVDPSNPSAVWSTIGAFLLTLAVLYTVLARLGGHSVAPQSD
ncbi:MAG: MFS transporter [Proteobacteria bacterium]|nr:MFS transporter [Pseudomonadota bacterium]